ncbi:Enamine deaminase RidA, house cleaning of reactive enamine intermediates, YjgF/YER057c/UK114 family [Rhizobiales bacterium GAS191]|nr:Enamine deaminase RidA, house cleaning of reactive enamine intermediates, YjgF/YER057c/UK114 family [Rhizobiales bacterium GAS191]
MTPHATRRFISSGSPWEELAGYSRAVLDEPFVFVSGTVGTDFATGIMPEGAAAQTEQAIDTIEKALADAGATILDIVRVRVFVPESADMAEVSAVIRRRIGPSRAANTTVCSPLAVPGARVEIEVTARKSADASPNLHVASERVRAPASSAFAFLADGRSLGRWALGCFETTARPDGLFAGHSLFDGKELLVRVEGDPEKLCVTYHVGPALERLSPRIVAKVEAAAQRPGGEGECLVSLIAERTPDMTEQRWRHLTTTHATEILLIKALIEGSG